MRPSFAVPLAAVLALAGCSDIDVTTSQDPATDFTKIRSWAWYDAINNDAPDPALSELSRRRIKNCIQSELEARGYSWGPSDKADMLVKWVAVASGNVELAPVGFRFGIDDPATRGPIQGPATMGEGSLVIDVLSNQPPRKVIWRGTAQATVNRDLSDEERQDRIQKAVSKTFASFPTHPSH
jgi:hypothetical protein